MKLFNYSIPAESINFDAECIPGYDSKSKNLIYRTRNVQGTNDFFLPSFEPFSDDLDRAIDLNVATFPTKLFDRNQEHGFFIVPFYFDQAKSVQLNIYFLNLNILIHLLHPGCKFQA